MGNNLNVLLNDKVIAALARKHNFCFYGENHLPDEDEIDKTLSDTRQHITSTLVGYATWLATQENPLTENIDDIVSSVKDLIELFEYEVMVAGRNWVLQDLQDQYQFDDEGFCGDRPNFIEVLDDYELHKRREDKKKYFENLREKIDKVNWDAVEDQTGEVDLDFEKDTLVGPEWEEQTCDNLEDHKASIEEIGYCSYCRDAQQEHDEYLERQNRQ